MPTINVNDKIVALYLDWSTSGYAYMRRRSRIKI